MYQDTSRNLKKSILEISKKTKRDVFECATDTRYFHGIVSIVTDKV